MTTPRRRAPRQAEAERNDQALLRAGREVLACDGAHASVAAIAARAGVGIGSLYRRYRTKEELFQHLCTLSLDQSIEAAEHGLGDGDPWSGLAGFVTACVEFGQGSMSAVAGTVEATGSMLARTHRADELMAALVDRAHAAGVLRPEVTAVDVSLLIEQLGRSPLVDQIRRQGRDDLLDAALAARRRLVAIALNGLRTDGGDPLPGTAPDRTLFSERWIRAPGGRAGRPGGDPGGDPVR